MGEVSVQRIPFEGDVPAGILTRLSDTLVDLDKPMNVSVNGEQGFSAIAPRDAQVLMTTLTEPLDFSSAVCAEIMIP